MTAMLEKSLSIATGRGALGIESHIAFAAASTAAFFSGSTEEW